MRLSFALSRTKFIHFQGKRKEKARIGIFPPTLGKNLFIPQKIVLSLHREQEKAMIHISSQLQDSQIGQEV
ncbi:MAG: hypothetical protein EGS41_05445 [Prevotella sp.]|nr:hypothetical protein [Prevotella sp.]